MANSLRDQLFQAGLVTEEQVKEADKPKPRKPKPAQKASKPKQKAPKQTSDLAQFYQQRATLERKEKQEAEKQKQEAARLKKERREKITALIKDHAIAHEDGDIRYNFMVGKTIKYVFVNAEQQQKLSDGELAITFHGGKRVLIPQEIGKQISQIDPDKIVVM